MTPDERAAFRRIYRRIVRPPPLDLSRLWDTTALVAAYQLLDWHVDTTLSTRTRRASAYGLYILEVDQRYRARAG